MYESSHYLLIHARGDGAAAWPADLVTEAGVVVAQPAVESYAAARAGATELGYPLHFESAAWDQMRAAEVAPGDVPDGVTVDADGD